MAKPRETINNDSAAAASGKDKRNRKRFIVYQNEDGTPDLSNLPEALRPVINPPPGPDAVPEAPPPEFDASIFKMLLPVIVSLEAAVAARKLDISPKQAAQCLTPAPQLADGIAAAAAKVANKYAAPLGRWADEIALVAIVCTWQFSAFAAMQQYRPVPITPEPPPPPPDKHYSTEAPPPPPPTPSGPETPPMDAPLFTGGET